jgi:flagellar hook-associated protein 3 FlgL
MWSTPLEGLPQSVTNASGGVGGNFAAINSDDRFQVRVNGPGGLQDNYRIVFDDSDTRINYFGGTSTLSEYFGFDTGVKLTTNADTIAIIERATSLADQVGDLLSVDIDGRFLFSGSKIGTQPIDVAGYLADDTVAFPPTDLNANATSAWYRGDSSQATARVSDDLTISYGVTAADDAIDKLVRAVRTIIDSRDTNGEISGDRLEGAMNLITAAIEELPDVRSRIGRDIKTIEQTNIIHEDFTLLAINAIADIENVNIVEAANLLSANETQLQASYLSLSRINQLSLINFL